MGNEQEIDKYGHGKHYQKLDKSEMTQDLRNQKCHSIRKETLFSCCILLIHFLQRSRK